jgi:hypothetical protein
MTARYSENNTTKIIINNTTYVIYDDIVSEIGLLKEIKESLEENNVIENINLEGIEHDIIVTMFDILTFRNVNFGTGLPNEFNAIGMVKLITCMRFFLIDIKLIDRYINTCNDAYYFKTNENNSLSLLFLLKEFVKIPYNDSMLYLINKLQYRYFCDKEFNYSSIVTILSENNQFPYEFNFKLLSLAIEIVISNMTVDGCINAGGLVKLIYATCGANYNYIHYENSIKDRKHKISVDDKIYIVPHNNIDIINYGIRIDMNIPRSPFRTDISSTIAKICLTQGISNVLSLITTKKLIIEY